MYINALLISILVTGPTACVDNTEQSAKKHGDELWFEEPVHDYGEVLQESEGTWTFSFKNLGEGSIVINQVRSTCGCTVPEWTREPVEPGSRGEITVIYNTTRAGTFLKSLFVYSTAANSPVKLQIKGKVLPKEKG
jgi:hypothetical protein